MKKVLTVLSNNWGLVIIVIICLSFMAADIINHRLWVSDFQVYYRAASRMVSQEPLYNVYYENPLYTYKYSPVAPVFFIPFIVFPIAVAKIIYWLFLTGTVVLSFVIGSKAIAPRQPTHNLNTVFIIATLVLALHFLREIHLGQVNYLLFTCYVATCYLFMQGRSKLSLGLLAVTVFFKPFGFILIPYFIIKKNYRGLSVFFITLLFMAFIPLLFYHSWSDFVGLYKGWMHELTIEMSHKQLLLKAQNHTIFSVLARYTPIRYVLTGDLISKIYQLVVLSGIAILYYYYQKKAQKENRFIVNNFAFLIALIPLFAFTSENAFCFTGLTVLSILMNFKLLTLVERTVAILGFICIGGNFSELLGKQASLYIDQSSFISFGALAVLAVLCSARWRNVM